MRNATFYLGPGGSWLDSREVSIFDVTNLSHDVPPDLWTYQSLAGTAETITVALPDNRLWQLVLTDVCDGNEQSPTVFRFSTDESVEAPSGEVRLLAFEDLSSSSSSVSSSSKSSSSSSTPSSSSNSSSSSLSSSSVSSRTLSSSSNSGSSTSQSSQSSASSLSSVSSSSSSSSESSSSNTSSSSLSSSTL